MAQIIELTSLHDPAVAAYAQLTEAQLRSRLEPELGVFIAESPKVIVTALDAGLRPLSLLMERRHLTGQGAALLARCGDIPVYTGDRELLAQLTGYTLTRGILCAMARPALPRVEALEERLFLRCGGAPECMHLVRERRASAKTRRRMETAVICARHRRREPSQSDVMLVWRYMLRLRFALALRITPFALIFAVSPLFKRGRKTAVQRLSR